MHPLVSAVGLVRASHEQAREIHIYFGGYAVIRYVGSAGNTTTNKMFNTSHTTQIASRTHLTPVSCDRLNPYMVVSLALISTRSGPRLNSYRVLARISGSSGGMFSDGRPFCFPICTQTIHFCNPIPTNCGIYAQTWDHAFDGRSQAFVPVGRVNLAAVGTLSWFLSMSNTQSAQWQRITSTR